MSEPLQYPDDIAIVRELTAEAFDQVARYASIGSTGCDARDDIAVFHAFEGVVEYGKQLRRYHDHLRKLKLRLLEAEGAS